VKISVSTEEEKKFWGQGYKLIAGLDEAGRGPLAGPVVCGGVVLPIYVNLENLKNLNDSKKLSKKQREDLFWKILNIAVDVVVCVVDEKIIDTLNIYQATAFGFKNCVRLFNPKPEIVLIDGMEINFKNIISKKIVKGDTKVASIAAASIVAKVFRDNIMEYYHKSFPYYQFNKNYGYPTKYHKEAIKKYGILDIHRRSFSPVKKRLNECYHL